MAKEISVIIPALNEERVIRSVVEDIKKTLGDHIEVVVVDDGSSDNTAAEAKNAGAVVISHPVNCGYGKSLKDGILAAKHDVIVITDADGTYPIEKIPALVSEFEKGFDMMVGARTGKYYRGSFLKMPARIVLKYLVEFTTGRHIPDINSGLRIFRKKDAVVYFADICNGFSFTTTITLIYMLTGKIVGYMPIPYHKRVGKTKVRIIRDSLRTFQYVIEVITIYNPLKLFLLMSAKLAFIALIFAVCGMVFMQSWLGIAATISAIGAVLVFCIGLLIYAMRARDTSISQS